MGGTAATNQQTGRRQSFQGNSTAADIFVANRFACGVRVATSLSELDLTVWRKASMVYEMQNLLV